MGERLEGKVIRLKAALLGGREVQLLLVTGGERPQCDQRMKRTSFVQTVAAGAVWLALSVLLAVVALGFCGYFD